MRKFVVILTIILLYSVACKKEDFLWDLPRGECNFVYSAWSSRSPNNIQTRTYTSSPPECTGKPPQDSIQRLCVILPSVKIGSQTWTSKNLDVSTYRTGEIIPQVQDGRAWSELKTGAWCYYQNQTANGSIYGKLYNWYAVNDPRGLAPKGYHIPSDAEWTMLTNYLGGETLAGGKMKETGFSHWFYPNSNATNTSGFEGLPGGECNPAYNATFQQINAFGSWWSSTYVTTNWSNTPQKWPRYATLHFDNGNLISSISASPNNGFSARCIKD